MTTDENIILDTDPRAAEAQIGTVWKSATGGIFVDERAARYDGCTHVSCQDCGKPVVKTWISCDACRERKAIERYLKRPEEDWTGECLVVGDRFYFDEDSVVEALLDEEIPMDYELARPEVGERECVPQVDPEDLFSDYTDEDGESYVPDEILPLIEQLNAAIEKHTRPLYHGNMATRLAVATWEAMVKKAKDDLSDEPLKGGPCTEEACESCQ